MSLYIYQWSSFNFEHAAKELKMKRLKGEFLLTVCKVHTT